MGTPVIISAADIESVLCSLVTITSARVVTGIGGAIAEIHVLTNSSHAAKQVVRDIESALMAQFGLEIDHKKISVAQTQDGKMFRFAESRLKLLDVSTCMNGVKSETVVHLKKGEEVFTGKAAGTGTGYNQPRLIATATLRAVENCQGLDGSFMLEDLNPSITLGGRPVVVVSVVLITSRGEDLLVGVAVVRQDPYKAVVNATLDAVNRRLGSLPSSK